MRIPTSKLTGTQHIAGSGLLQLWGRVNMLAVKVGFMFAASKCYGCLPPATLIQRSTADDAQRSGHDEKRYPRRGCDGKMAKECEGQENQSQRNPDPRRIGSRPSGRSNPRANGTEKANGLDEEPLARIGVIRTFRCRVGNHVDCGPYEGAKHPVHQAQPQEAQHVCNDCGSACNQDATPLKQRGFHDS